MRLDHLEYYKNNVCPGTEDLALVGLVAATTSGASNFLSILAENIGPGFPVEIHPEDKHQLVVNAVMSDCPKTVKTILSFLHMNTATQEVVQIAKERGNQEIISLISPNSQDRRRTEESKISLQTFILNKTSGLLNLVPKSAEFPYNEKIEKLEPLLTGTLVTYDKLLQELHVPQVHVGVKELDSVQKKEKKMEWEVCPKACIQKRSCQRIRETFKLVKIIIKRLGEINPIFDGMELTIIGSVREGSRVFFNDEVDLHLSLNEDLKDFTCFDKMTQKLMMKSNHKAKDYTTNRGEFRSRKFFMDFLQGLYEIVSNLQLPEDFTMKPLTTNFSPCLICMKIQYGEPQAYRCRHVPGCQVHLRCKCEDKEECSCHCSCRQFSTPSLTHSKIGAVLHLEWVETDGTTVNLDCDLNVPTVPCGTPYNGAINEISVYLLTEKPVNWLEENKKLEAMETADINFGNLKQDSWPVKFRLINKDTVLTRQVRV